MPGPHGGVCPAFAMTEDGTVLAAGPAGEYGIGAREKMYLRPGPSDWRRWWGPEDSLELYALLPIGPQTVLAGTADGLWVSQQDPPGRDWSQSAFAGERVTDLALLRDSCVYLGLASGEIHRSCDRGASWTLVAQRDDFLPRRFVMDDAQRLYARNLLNRVYRFDGASWSQFPGSTQPAMVAVHPLHGIEFLAIGYGGINHSTDDGASWVIRHKVDFWPQFASFAASESGSIYASLTQLVEDSIVGGIYKSMDGGVSWTQLHRGPITGIRMGPRGTLLAASFAAGIVRVDTATGATTYLGSSSAHVRQIAMNAGSHPWSTHLFATLDTLGHAPGVLRSRDEGRTWEWIPLSYSVQTHVTTDLDSSVAAWNPDAQRLHLSRDNGDSWQKVEMPVRTVAVHLRRDGDILVGAFTPTGQVFRSTDDGDTWSAVTVDPGQIVYALAGSDTATFAATPTGVFRSFDAGVTWENVHTFSETGVVPTGLSVTDLQNFWAHWNEASVACAAPSGSFMMVSDNTGDSWSTPPIPSGPGVLHSPGSDGRVHAVLIALGYDAVEGPGDEPNMLISDDGQIFQTVFNTSYMRYPTCQVNAGWWFGTRGYGVYRWDSMTGIPENSVPSAFALHANYPNPFNPSTVIPFTLEKRMEISVIITDILGREVARPLDAVVREAGRHELRFDAADLPGGTYVVRLHAGDSMRTGKMLLVK